MFVALLHQRVASVRILPRDCPRPLRFSDADELMSVPLSSARMFVSSRSENPRRWKGVQLMGALEVARLISYLTPAREPEGNAHPLTIRVLTTGV